MAGEITIVGFDDLDESIDCIRDGVVDGVVVQKQYVMGYMALEDLLKLNAGETVPEITDTGVVIASAANVDSYKEETLVVGAAPAESEPAAEEPAAEEAPAAAEDTHLVFVTPLMANPYWDVVEDGWRQAGTDYGIKVDYVGPTSLDLDEMIKYMETAIAQGVDGIGTMALNTEAMAKPIADAKAAGIPVVLIDTDAPDSERDAYAGTSNFAAGQAAGEFMAEQTGGKATIGILTGRLDQANLVQRVDGFKDAISQYPDMQVVDMQPDDSDLQIAIQKTEAMLLAHPEIDAFFGSEGFGAPALCKVVKEAGMAGEITIVGFDDLDESIDCIRDGVVDGVVVQKQYVMGYMALEDLLKLNSGHTIPEILDTGVVIASSDNVETYKEETLTVQ
jgi:ribose transport system substrate-binding protein